MKKVSKTKFKQLLKKSLVLADMRSPVSFRDGHIENAINLPLRNFINKIMPMPKTTVIVAYSTNMTDVDLVQGLRYAEQLGFTELYYTDYTSLKEKE